MSAETTALELPAWMFKPHPTCNRFLVAIEPSGKAHVDGCHGEPNEVAKARELFQAISVIRPPEDTRYVMVTVEEVPVYRGGLDQGAITTLNANSPSERPS